MPQRRKRAHRYASDNFRNGTTVMPEGFEHLVVSNAGYGLMEVKGV
jgi:hypothetical protein